MKRTTHPIASAAKVPARATPLTRVSPCSTVQSPAPDNVGADVATRPRKKTDKKTDLRPPSRYQVLMINDDFTPMDFVVEVLCRFFSKSPEEATTIMLQIHRFGAGVCGVYDLDVAETKISQVTSFALTCEHPLRCRLQRLQE